MVTTPILNYATISLNIEAGIDEIIKSKTLRYNKLLNKAQDIKSAIIEKSNRKKDNLKYFNDQFFFVIDMAHFD